MGSLTLFELVLLSLSLIGAIALVGIMLVEVSDLLRGASIRRQIRYIATSALLLDAYDRDER